jgi:hypothetical protein
MSILQANGVCPAILTGIEEILNPNNPSNIMTPVGGVQALLDPENRQGVTIEQLGQGGNGHRKQVRVAYKQRAIPSEITNTKTCDDGTEKPRLEEVVDVNLHAQQIIKVDEATVRLLCDTYSSLVRIPVAMRDRDGNAIAYRGILKEMAENLLMDLDAMRQKINQSFLSAIGLNFGKYVGGATVKSFPVIKSADHAIVLTGFNQWKQELKKIGMNGTPLVFGGGNIDLAVMSAELGCCNSAGQDLSLIGKYNGFKFYEDYSDMNTYFGHADAFGMFLPKMAQIVTFNKYVGSFAQQIGSMDRGTMPDPKLPGLSYDIRLKPSECDEDYNLYVNLDYDFYFAPLDMFKAGDRLNGINGVLKGIATAI